MKITLKDGSIKEYGAGMSVIEIAKDISEGLARAACAGEVNGEVVDLRIEKFRIPHSTQKDACAILVSYGSRQKQQPSQPASVCGYWSFSGYGYFFPGFSRRQ